MSNFFNFVESIWDNLKAGEAKTQAHFAIKRDHIDNGNQLGPHFEAGQHYLQIIINEMFLANQRQWFVNYDPMAFVASDLWPSMTGPEDQALYDTTGRKAIQIILYWEGGLKTSHRIRDT